MICATCSKVITSPDDRARIRVRVTGAVAGVGVPLQSALNRPPRIALTSGTAVTSAPSGE